ncbi:MAG: S1 RNA-binding domain-containing protein [Defluviitaleaceae bacterium]|nr:S1 RNA-binding domain-containing protein [Defluviitaleaceae bacterium]
MSDNTETPKIEIGDIVDGQVIRIKPFGAIVSLPDNQQGLVHISHISVSFVQNIEDHLAVGDEVKVKVIAKDAETGKISLSIKDALPPVRTEYRQRAAAPADNSFEDKLKEWVKVANERQAGLNKRNKRR